jgi:hypothetical protein
MFWVQEPLSYSAVCVCVLCVERGLKFSGVLQANYYTVLSVLQDRAIVIVCVTLPVLRMNRLAEGGDHGGKTA